MGAGSSGGVNISCAAQGAGASKDVRPWKVKVPMFHKLNGSLCKFSSGCAKVFK